MMGKTYSRFWWPPASEESEADLIKNRPSRKQRKVKKSAKQLLEEDLNEGYEGGYPDGDREPE